MLTGPSLYRSRGQVKLVKQGYRVLFRPCSLLVQQTWEEMEVFFTFLAERYERGSVMLTSNLPFAKWEKIFKDPMTTAAAIDQLVHHSVILELNLASYRLESSMKRLKADAAKQMVC